MTPYEIKKHLKTLSTREATAYEYNTIIFQESAKRIASKIHLTGHQDHESLNYFVSDLTTHQTKTPGVFSKTVDTPIGVAGTATLTLTLSWYGGVLMCKCDIVTGDLVLRHPQQPFKQFLKEFKLQPSAQFAVMHDVFYEDAQPFQVKPRKQTTGA